jgi:hypothetical protein
MSSSVAPLQVKTETQHAQQLQPSTSAQPLAQAAFADFFDPRPQAVAQRRRQELADVSQQSKQLSLYSTMMQNRAQATQTQVPRTGGAVAQLQTKIEHKTGLVNMGDALAPVNYEVGKKMTARLDVNDPVQGSAVGDMQEWNVAIRKKYPRARVIRGHLLNHDLGGFGVSANLFPISDAANREHSYAVEKKVKAALNTRNKNAPAEDDRTVNYSVEVNDPAGNATEAAFACQWRYKDGGHWVERQHTVTSKLTARHTRAGIEEGAEAKDGAIKDVAEVGGGDPYAPRMDPLWAHDGQKHGDAGPVGRLAAYTNALAPGGARIAADTSGSVGALASPVVVSRGHGGVSEGLRLAQDSAREIYDGAIREMRKTRDDRYRSEGRPMTATELRLDADEYATLMSDILDMVLEHNLDGALAYAKDRLAGLEDMNDELNALEKTGGDGMDIVSEEEKDGSSH